MYFFLYEFHYFVAKAKLNFLSTNPKKFHKRYLIWPYSYDIWGTLYF